MVVRIKLRKSRSQTASRCLRQENKRLKTELADYEAYLEKICALPNCNTCADKGICRYKPPSGQICRISCPLWKDAG